MCVERNEKSGDREREKNMWREKKRTRKNNNPVAVSVRSKREESIGTKRSKKICQRASGQKA